jgi:two-component system phosphate regulon sensor histidine kinase PhoR
MKHATASGRIRVGLLSAAALALLCAAFGARAMSAMRPVLTSPQLAETRLFELMVFLVVGAFVAGLAIALTASSVAVAPLSDLTLATIVMRRDLGMRSGMRGEDEIGRLGEAIDQLAAWVATEKRSLEDDRDRLAAILESMAEGVLVTGRDADRDGVIVLANRALREMLLLDRRITGRAPIEAIRVAGLDDILAAAKREGGAQGEIELSGIRPRRLLVRATPLRSAKRDAHTIGLVVVFNDVTDLRRLESMRRDFVANVSHELRTPITAIRAAAETLAGGALSDPTAAADFVGIISRHSDRLERLVEDLLDLSKIEARRWQLAIEPLEIGEAIGAAIETVGVAARSRGTSVRGNVPSGLVAQADRRAVEQVLVNLLDNAVKYAAPSATIEVRARCSDGRLIVEVEDDGPGIDPRHLPRLFERFYRVDAGRSRAVGGTGLGLSIVKHLVEAMGGTVQVESRIAEGTIFSVSLPMAVPPVARGSDAVPSSSPS